MLEAWKVDLILESRKGIKLTRVFVDGKLIGNSLQEQKHIAKLNSTQNVYNIFQALISPTVPQRSPFCHCQKRIRMGAKKWLNEQCRKRHYQNQKYK